MAPASAALAIDPGKPVGAYTIDVWSARSYDEASVIPEGSKVDVLAIEGATALVHPRE